MDEKDFIKEYKEMFDGIEARTELKDKILRQKKPKRNKFRPIAAAIATTAAAVMIFAAVHDYSFDRDDSGIISTVTVSETEPPEQKRQDEQAPKATAVADNSEQTVVTAAPAQKAANKNTVRPKSTSAPAHPRITPEPYTEHRESSEAPAARYSAPETPPEASSADTVSETVPETDHENRNDQQTTEGSLVLPFRTGTVTLRMSAESVLTNLILQSMQQNDELDSAEEYHTEQWDNERYFNYIGNDILNDISLGSDMIYTGGYSSYFTVSSDGRIKDDQRIFVFNGSGSRSVSILTSRDTSFVDAILSSPEIDKKNIKDIEMTVFGSDLTYFFYIKSNDVAYIVTTEGLDGEEIAELISSIN